MAIAACVLIVTVIVVSIATKDRIEEDIPELIAVPPFVLAYMGTGDDPYQPYNISVAYGRFYAKEESAKQVFERTKCGD